MHILLNSPWLCETGKVSLFPGSSSWGSSPPCPTPSDQHLFLPDYLSVFLAHYSRKEMLELDLLHFHSYINTNFTEVNEITLVSGECLRRIIECIYHFPSTFLMTVSWHFKMSHFTKMHSLCSGMLQWSCSVGPRSSCCKAPDSAWKIPGMGIQRCVQW